MPQRTLSTEPPIDPARYVIVRPLGAGGAGSVYLALDRETNEHVALKKLERVDEKSVLRFKREFRSLANLHHPNLVRLYELDHASDSWFLTMEYVEGRSLSEELRSSSSSNETRDQRRTAANDQQVDTEFFNRAIDLFHQLAAGVRAVHQAGMLHRDLKPGNVMVTKDGRVIVLDFGLVRELDMDEPRLTLEGTISGTPAYMSPEQADAQPLTEATDWYSFGVMLYETLRGQLPIGGRNEVDLIQRKLRMDPEPLRGDADGPLPLRELCMALLRRDPAARPSGERIVAALAEMRPEPVLRVRTQSEELLPATDVSLGLAATPLFGRDRELAELRGALARAGGNQTLVAHIRGASGSGKSALVERFLDEPELAGNSGVLVLRSRCYEREAMPFKALDGVMDALVTDLMKLEDYEVARLLPQGIAELSHLFPVFKRLPTTARLIAGRGTSNEAAEVRRRAEIALQELIVRLAAHRTIVVWIDDLQWGDLDSSSVIKNWLQQSIGSPLLLIFSYRADEAETSACLKLLFQTPSAATQAASEVFIDVAALADSEVRALCTQRLLADPTVPPGVIDRIVEEADGNPFLAQQLVALAIAKRTRGDEDMDNLSMEELVLRTGALLLPESRELLNVLAIAGRPLAPHLALTAAEIRREGRNHIHALQSLRLVRTRAVGGQRWLEVYHDRVREGVQAALSENEREQLHARLLQVLEVSRVSDPDWLHELARGANLSAAALRYGLLAADRASATLAFERAAELYARCLDLNDRPKDAAELWSKLASSLARCRRGAKAAEAYRQAAEHAPEEEQPPLLRLAASHLLRSGRFDEGERLVGRVLDLLGLDVPKSELGLMAAIGWERARLAVRGYELKSQESTEASRRMSRTTELYGTLAVDTQLHEPLRAVLFQTRALRIGLETGEIAPLARAMCLTAAVACMSGTARAARNSAELIERAEKLSQGVHNEDLAVELPSVRALCAMFLGRPLEVLEHSSAADRAYEKKGLGGGHGDYFYMFAVHAVRLAALNALGRHNVARAELRDYLARAEATDNRTAILQATLAQTIAERTTDNCATSRARLDIERMQLPKASFGVLHMLHMIATMQAACATGDHDWAIKRLAEDWPVYLRAPIHRTAYTACVAHFAHARLLLNQYVASGGQRDVADVVKPDLRALASLPPTALRDGVSFRLRARCAYLQGDTSGAIQLFRKSAKALDEAFYLDEPERDRFAIGCLVGGPEGARLCAAAGAALSELGVQDPVTELRGFYPELFAAGLVK